MNPNPSSERSFSSHIAWTLAARLLMTATSVAAGVIVARFLGAAAFGQLAVITVVIATLVQIGSSGLPSANTYFISKDPTKLNAASANSLLFALLVGTLLTLGTIALASIRPDVFNAVPLNILTIGALSIPFQLLTLMGLNVFLAMGQVQRFNLLDLAGQSFVLINATLALVVFKDGLWLLVLLNSAASVAVALTVAALIRRLVKQAGDMNWRPARQLFTSMMKYGIKIHIAVLAGALIFRADLLVVNHFKGNAEAGVYGVASQVAMLLMVLPGVIATILFPRVSATGDEKGETTSFVTRQTALTMLIVCLLTAPASFLLPLLYGVEFKDAAVQLLILLPGVFLIGLESVLVQHFNAIGLPPAIPIFWIITLLVNLALVFSLVPTFGARGAAVASTASYVLIFGLVAGYFHVKTKRRFAETFIPNAGEIRTLLLFKRVPDSGAGA